MTQSKPEVHLQILKAVALHEAATEGKVAFYTKIAMDVIKQSLILLSRQGLLECNQKGSYLIARRGMAVLRHFGLLEMQPQAIENY